MGPSVTKLTNTVKLCCVFVCFGQIEKSLIDTCIQCNRDPFLTSIIHHHDIHFTDSPHFMSFSVAMCAMSREWWCDLGKSVWSQIFDIFSFLFDWTAHHKERYILLKAPPESDQFSKFIMIEGFSKQWKTHCHRMTPFLFFIFCWHLMTSILKMLSH